MRELAADKNHTVHIYLAKNPTIANYPEIIKQLAADTDPEVSQRLVNNVAVPDHLKAGAIPSANPDWKERWASTQGMRNTSSGANAGHRNARTPPPHAPTI